MLSVTIAIFIRWLLDPLLEQNLLLTLYGHWPVNDPRGSGSIR